MITIDTHCGCPYCAGPGEHLGVLAGRRHYRCRDCGTMFDTNDEQRYDIGFDSPHATFAYEGEEV